MYPTIDINRCLLPRSGSCAAVLLFVVSSVTTTGYAQGHIAPIPRAEPNAAVQKAFIAVARELRPPSLADSPQTTLAFCTAYAAKFQAASSAMTTLQVQLGNIATTPGANQPLAQAVAAAVGSIGTGFAGIADDLQDTWISSSLSYWCAADGYEQLATLLPYVSSDFSDAAIAAHGASQVLTSIVATLSIPTANPFDPFFGSFFAFRVTQQALVEGLLPDLTVPADFAGSPSCPPGTFRGCTNYSTTTYSNVSCGAWSRVTGGLSVGGDHFGIEICPDGGLWKRTCTVDACKTEKCVCECYQSRWDRFWGVGGSNRTVTTTDLGCTPDSFTEFEFECAGPPPAAAPAAPDPHRSLGDSANC